MLRFIEAVIGRRLMWKLGRRLYYGARRDGSLVMGSNGEELLQLAFARQSAATDRPLCVVDVGANLGDWTGTMVAALEQAGAPDATIYAFEPVPVIRAKLEPRFARPLRHRIVISPKAISDRPGKQMIVCHGEDAGSHHLSTEFMGRPGEETEVEVDCLDGLFPDGPVDLIKIDAEGFDPLVIKGGEGLLRDQRVGVIQFEYSALFIRSRSYAYDMFEIAERHGYNVGLLTGKGIEVFERWHSDLEQFIACNMVMCRPDTLAWLPAQKSIYLEDNTRRTEAL